MKKMSVLLSLFVMCGFMGIAEAKTVTVTLTKDNTLVINDIFDGSVVANISHKAKEMDAKLPSKDPIFLVINSPGGSIDAGIELIENLNRLNRPVHTITIFAASMGFQTVQGVSGVRLVQIDGTLMSHKARGGFYGEFPGQLDNRYKYYLTRVFNLDKRAVERTKGKHDLKSYHALIENEYWCDGEECIKEGFADMIVNAKCDASLGGTHNVVWGRFMFMDDIVEIVDVMSNCPTITSPLDYNIFINGKPLFGNRVDPNKKTNDYSYDTKLFPDLTVERLINIKKLVEEKIQNRKSSSKATREIIRY